MASLKSAVNYQKFVESINKISQSRHSSTITKNCVYLNNEAVKTPDNKFHISSKRDYPAAAALPLPVNIDATETTRFSPQRSRDISGSHIQLSHLKLSPSYIDITAESTIKDPHVESYDCFGAVSLNASMQSNVPTPFGGMHKFTHLNMPGGQWSQEGKFISQNLQNSHYTNLRKEARASWSAYNPDAITDKGIAKNIYHFRAIKLLANTEYFLNRQFSNMHVQLTRNYVTNKTSSTTNNIISVEKLSKKDQLKKAFKEYGSTVIIFHVIISLTSLGVCYALISGGIDVMSIIEKLGLGSSAVSNKIATGASTFVIAYAIHKIFAPVRISITLASTPFIVRYLRLKGILKPTKK